MANLVIFLFTLRKVKKKTVLIKIKQLLIKTGMIFGDNPYEKYMVLGDDMGTEHIFYRKK